MPGQPGGVCSNSAALIVFCFFSKVSPSKETQKNYCTLPETNSKSPLQNEWWEDDRFPFGARPI